MRERNLDLLFNPKSIALIGASATPFKWGSLIPLNILKGNYQGNVFPVNPGLETMLGHRCYPSVADIPGPVDMALIFTPAPTVPGIVEQCGEKGVPYLVIITADFSETGPAGAALEAEVLEKARQFGLRLVGPNSMGLFSSQTQLHALMPPTMPLKGAASMVSQSGNVGVQMLAWGADEGIGFEKFVSSGNEADLNSADYLAYFTEDGATRVILAYMEGMGPGIDLYPAARAAAVQKPVLLYKGGRTRIGGKAAASHSGAIAGSNRVFKAAMHQAGVIQIQTSQAMMDCAKAFSNLPLPDGNRVGILTRGGGWGVITSDACEESGLNVPPLPDELIKKIDRLLPSYWSRGNPVDMVATISHDPFLDCLEILAAWDDIHAIIALGAVRATIRFPFSEKVTGPPEVMGAIEKALQFRAAMTAQPDAILTGIKQLTDLTGKPIVAVSTGPDSLHRETLRDYQVVSYPTPERAVRVMAHMVNYTAFRRNNTLHEI
jgi:acyl-CoA synthetase (NDP forming)